MNNNQPRFIFFTGARMRGGFSSPHCSKCLKPITLIHIKDMTYQYTCGYCGYQEQVILISKNKV